MIDPVRELRIDAADARPRATTEWLVTNGLGGYASGEISGATTRRYHGLLIAALPEPMGRFVMLSHLSELLIRPDGSSHRLSHDDARDGKGDRGGLTAFRLELGLPVWVYRFGDVHLEKRVVMPYRQNIVYIAYRLAQGRGPIAVELRPSVQFRPIEGPVGEPSDQVYLLSVCGQRYEVSSGPDLPPLRLMVKGKDLHFSTQGGVQREVFYRHEAERGYDARGRLWCPGAFSATLAPGGEVVLIAGAESWSNILALTPVTAFTYEIERRRRLIREAAPAAREPPVSELVLAADAFVVTPVGRVVDRVRAEAAGDEIRTVIAGYHWFTDWGRDTMISLEGLTLVTGRHHQARWILAAFAHHIREGLIPNLFPEGESEGLYHTADATLWLFHALDRYAAWTGDRDLLGSLLPALDDIVARHIAGTRFGIRVDPADGLLRQGAEGYQLTWMDAKVDDWVVTPRRGKAVEINALWYNALRLLAGWQRELGDAARAAALEERAAAAARSFNARFWFGDGGYLYDVVDGENGDDDACRPNQVLAISLAHPVLARERWERVLDVAHERLLTPVGLRSLAPGHPDYKAKYFGDLRARDAAYHQGTVWAWLIGPFVDAWLKVHPDDRAGARRLLHGLLAQLDQGAVGSINEIFDAEAPFEPRGCIAQAWSVAEVLRCWIATEPEAEIKRTSA